MDKTHKCNFEWKVLGTKEHILYYSVYISSKIGKANLWNSKQGEWLPLRRLVTETGYKGACWCFVWSLFENPSSGVFMIRALLYMRVIP